MNLTIAENYPFDLSRLLETRLLVTASSGSGKSYALRRLLEQAAPHVQILVIDPEGEFHTLREKFDLLVCAPSGADAVATPATASLLVRFLLESGVSAVLNIYDLPASQRQDFVRNFCDALVNAHRDQWRNVLIVLDEAHIYAPEGAKSESGRAVIDLATRGRKRGFGLCLATQRLSKLHKDAAAEMLNKLIGRTGLPNDIKRAADELGVSQKEMAVNLRELTPGQFYAYGPAFPDGVQRIKIGSVVTHHPEAGKRFLEAPPEPSPKIRKLLAERLQDLPKQADDEAKTVGELREKIKEQSAAIIRLTSAGVTGGISEKKHLEILNREIGIAKSEGYHEAALEAHAIADKLRPILQSALSMLPTPGIPVAVPGKFVIQDGNSLLPQSHAGLHKSESSAPDSTAEGLPSGAERILRELVSRAPAGYSKYQIAALTGFAPSGGTFQTYMSRLRKAGYFEEIGGLIKATKSGIAAVGGKVHSAPTSPAACLAMWKAAIPGGAGRILELVVRHPNGLTREIISKAVAIEKTGGTFGTYISILNKNGLIQKASGDIIKPAGIFIGE